MPVNPCYAQRLRLDQRRRHFLAAVSPVHGLGLPGRSPTRASLQAAVNVGMPPVLGADGILYGFYQSPSPEQAAVTQSTDRKPGRLTWRCPSAARADSCSSCCSSRLGRSSKKPL